MNKQLKVTGKFLGLLAHKPRDNLKIQYLRLESLLAGGFFWKLRARIAERRLSRFTQAQKDADASGPEYEQLYDKLTEFENRDALGKNFGTSAIKNIYKIKDAGIPEPFIRNWAINGYISADGVLVDSAPEPKINATSVLGWTWHALTASTTLLFLVYAWVLPGPVWRKLIASILVIIVFGLLSLLMNSQSLSALPPSHKLRSRIRKLLGG